MYWIVFTQVVTLKDKLCDAISKRAIRLCDNIQRIRDDIMTSSVTQCRSCVTRRLDGSWSNVVAYREATKFVVANRVATHHLTRRPEIQREKTPAATNWGGLSQGYTQSLRQVVAELVHYHVWSKTYLLLINGFWSKLLIWVNYWRLSWFFESVNIRYFWFYRELCRVLIYCICTTFI